MPGHVEENNAQITTAKATKSPPKIPFGMLEGKSPLPMLRLFSINIVRFCKANAESAHALVHWRHSLNTWVVEQLKNEGYMNPDKLAERAKLSRKKLNKRALKIIDDWDKKREIKSLYESFKATLNTARETTVCIF